MFETLEEYLDSRDLTYVRKDNLIEIEWNHCETCLCVKSGWRIKTIPDEIGEEWIKLQFLFDGIEDEVQFDKCWDTVMKDRAWWNYPNISSYYGQVCKRIDGIPIMEKELYLSCPNSFLTLEEEMDLEFMEMARVAASIMLENGRDGFYDFVERHLPAAFYSSLPF